MTQLPFTAQTDRRMAHPGGPYHPCGGKQYTITDPLLKQTDLWLIYSWWTLTPLRWDTWHNNLSLVALAAQTDQNLTHRMR